MKTLCVFFIISCFLYSRSSGQPRKTVRCEPSSYGECVDTFLIDTNYVPHNSLITSLLKRNEVGMKYLIKVNSLQLYHICLEKFEEPQFILPCKGIISFGYIPIHVTQGERWGNSQWTSLFFVHEYYFQNKKDARKVFNKLNALPISSLLYFRHDEVFWFFIQKQNRIFFVLSFADKNDSPNMILLKKEIKRIARKQKWQRITEIYDK